MRRGSKGRPFGKGGKGKGKGKGKRDAVRVVYEDEYDCDWDPEDVRWLSDVEWIYVAGDWLAEEC